MFTDTVKVVVAAIAFSIGLSAAAASAGESDYPTKVYWGDTHLHSSLSVDSSGNGNQRITPDKAYRFASGHSVRGNNDQEVKLSRPLDFLVIADHAVNLGVLPRVIANDPAVLKTKVGKEWRAIWDQFAWSSSEMLTAKSYEDWIASVNDVNYYNEEAHRTFFWKAWENDYVVDKEFYRSIWNEVCAKADEYNQPGKFTAFIGFEWTPAYLDDEAPNLHRNVVFRGDRHDACQVLPFSHKDSRDVEDLWAYMEAYEEKTGDDVLAIPHNGNLTRGNLFGPLKFDDKPLDLTYLKARRRWEPLIEVTQIKGDSETHPLLSPTDEFASFEKWIWDNEQSTEVLGGNYARSGLKRGLDYEMRAGVNPFKFGMLGSSDSHTGLSAIAEDNFSGKFTIFEPTPHRALEHWWYSASGLAAVWATGNTRTEIFDAMERREVYATTGTRISVRLFGGWSYKEEDATDNGFVDIGYRGGVPMGGDLMSAPDNSAPRFLIRAVKDPDGANLDRVQVIKGWRDPDGVLKERVFDVALSDDRAVGADGKAEAIKSTVDVENASYSNSVGEVEFALLWEDPEFNPEHAAFYYVRVIEIPTPRWTAYDAAHYGTLEKIPEEATDGYSGTCLYVANLVHTVNGKPSVSHEGE